MDRDQYFLIFTIVVGLLGCGSEQGLQHSDSEEDPVTSRRDGSSASGKTYHVATTGNDANPGTSMHPFRTIQAATIIVDAGDTVLVAPGTYDAGLVNHRSGTANARISFRSSERHGARILTSLYKAIDNYGEYVDKLALILRALEDLEARNSGSRAMRPT